jgi:hypothetical protein
LIELSIIDRRSHHHQAGQAIIAQAQQLCIAPVGAGRRSRPRVYAVADHHRPQPNYLDGVTVVQTFKQRIRPAHRCSWIDLGLSSLNMPIDINLKKMPIDINLKKMPIDIIFSDSSRHCVGKQRHYARVNETMRMIKQKPKTLLHRAERAARSSSSPFPFPC